MTLREILQRLAQGGYFSGEELATALQASAQASVDLSTAVTGGGFANPMTTAGDLITGGASGAPARLAMGSALQNLRVNAGATALEYAGGDPPNFLVSRAAVQSVSTSSTTAVSFDTEVWDTNSFWAIGAATQIVFTTATAGKYTINGHVDFSSNGTGLRNVYLKKNGTVVRTISHNASNGDDSRHDIHLALNFADTDVLTMEVWQNSGGSRDILVTLFGFRFST